MRTRIDTVSLNRYGLDLYDGKVRDNKQAGVFEPAISKIKSLKFATEAAITILRIDDMIRLQAESKEDRYRNYEDDYWIGRWSVRTNRFHS